MSKASSPNAVVAVVRELFRQHRWAAVALASGAFAAGLMESMILALVAHSATAMVNGEERLDVGAGFVHVDSSLSIVLLFTAGLSVIRLLLQFPLAYLPARVSADTQAEFRNRLFNSYSRSSWAVQSGERDGHLQELLTSQTIQATQAMVYGTTLIVSGLTFVTLVLAAFTLGPVTALIVLVVAMCLFGLLRPIAKRGRRFAKSLSAAQLAYANAVGSAVRMAEETYAFGTAEAERQRVGSHNEAARELFLKTQFATRMTQGLYRGLVILLLVGALGTLYAVGAGRIASLGTIVLILVRASSYGQQAQVTWQGIQQAWPYVERLQETEQRYAESPPVGGDRAFVQGGSLRFEAVSFSYKPERPQVLTSVNAAIMPGDVIGIVGPSGAGKSTLVQLLLRMRQPTEGTIFLDDVDIDTISLDDWRRNVAYVPQEPRLLDASVEENIRFMRDIDPADIERAAKQAHIHETICEMTDGYRTMIGQRVDAVSGGQRQRLCIARALAGNPTVMVLDEPTSALDMESEQAIQETLSGLTGSLTMFIVTHRESMLDICTDVIDVVGGQARLRGLR